MEITRPYQTVHRSRIKSLLQIRDISATLDGSSERDDKRTISFRHHGIDFTLTEVGYHGCFKTRPDGYNASASQSGEPVELSIKQQDALKRLAGGDASEFCCTITISGGYAVAKTAAVPPVASDIPVDALPVLNPFFQLKETFNNAEKANLSLAEDPPISDKSSRSLAIHKILRRIFFRFENGDQNLADVKSIPDEASQSLAIQEMLPEFEGVYGRLSVAMSILNNYSQSLAIQEILLEFEDVYQRLVVSLLIPDEYLRSLAIQNMLLEFGDDDALFIAVHVMPPGATRLISIEGLKWGARQLIKKPDRN